MDGDLIVHTVTLNVCEPCINGVGDECHTPGCDLFLHAVDIPIIAARDQVGSVAPYIPPTGEVIEYAARSICRQDVACGHCEDMADRALTAARVFEFETARRRSALNIQEGGGDGQSV